MVQGLLSMVCSYTSPILIVCGKCDQYLLFAGSVPVVRFVLLY